MTKYNRKDDDGHKYLIPDDMLVWFQTQLDLIRQAKPRSDEWYDACARFNYYFEQYMVG